MIILDDNKIQFTVQRQKHIIGSKLFPVSSKSKLQVFNSEYTEELDKNDPNILRFTKLVDQCKFEMGHAYTSSDIVLQIADAIGLEAKFFSGWLIYPFSNTFPSHHAWAVINGSSVVDVMQFPEEIDMMMKADMTDPNFKEKIAIKIAEIRRKEKPLSESCFFGKINYDWVYYVGSPDDSENAKRIFRELISKYPNHPSYIRKGVRESNGRTELQNLINNEMGE